MTYINFYLSNCYLSFFILRLRTIVVRQLQLNEYVVLGY